MEQPRQHGHLYLNQARVKCRNNRIKLFCGLALFSSVLCGRNPQCWNRVNAVNVVIILLSRATTGKKRIALRFIVYAADQKIQLLLSINYFNQVLEKQKWKCSFNPSHFKGVALSLVKAVWRNLKRIPSQRLLWGRVQQAHNMERLSCPFKMGSWRMLSCWWQAYKKNNTSGSVCTQCVRILKGGIL